jgi:eukaryotic-like serine/threonine-protein kinase
VQLAKAGPSIEQLKRFIEDKPCDLQNIEVYYRIGLVHTGNGQYNEALEAFDVVEEASPGYRDAWRRAAVIREWLRAVAPRATQFTGGGGRYEILGELGRGGMAVVYRAHDKMLGREVALKFLSETLAAQKDMQELFQREARAVAALNHPNIVTIHDVGMLDGRAFICMELVDGASLETLMTQEPGLTVVESLRAIRQVLQALAYAHERKIIHRDIKPANMMRTESGLVKLMDFGLAKSIDSRNKKSVLAGTPQFMAPEQLRGEEADHRADLFAVGVTLYELLTGCLPYDGYDRATPPRRLIEHVPALPVVLDEAIMRALEPDKTKRQQSASELAGPIVQVLEAVAKTTGQKAPSGPLPVGAGEYRDPRDSVTFKR